MDKFLTVKEGGCLDMCFEWSISPMALKFLPHGQLLSLVKRQKSNLDREERKRASEIFFSGNLYRDPEGS